MGIEPKTIMKIQPMNITKLQPINSTSSVQEGHDTFREMNFSFHEMIKPFQDLEILIEISAFSPMHPLMYYYYPEIDKKLDTIKFYSVDYTAAGVEFHPISKAFTTAKKEGQEEVKNFVPYLWN